MDETSHRRPRSPLSRDLALISGLLFAVVASLLGVTWIGMDALSTVRAYVAGESFYSKGQKDAVHHLMRYALTRDEAEYDRYRAAIAVPLADASAREELARPDGSAEVGMRALEEGRNHPHDVGGMAALFRRSGLLREMEQAIEIWGEADGQVALLNEAAEALHAELRSGTPDPVRVSSLLTDVDTRNARLTILEESFSDTLGAGARRVHRLVLATASAAAAVLLAIGILSTARLLRRLRRSEDHFRTLIEHAHDIIAVIRPDAVMLYTSPAVQRVLGYELDALVGRSALDLIHADDQAAVVGALGRVVVDPSSTQHAEFRFRHADGTWRTLAATGGSAPGQGGELVVVVSSRDITEQRQLEQQLLQAQKMESIGRLAGGVAHDFNNLLTAILGSADLARNALPDGSPARAEIEQIEGASRRAANLTRQLLAFARRQVIEPRVFDLSDVVSGMEPMLHRMIGADVALEVRPSPRAASVRADPGQIEQVVVNLVVNARDAMPGGGRLTIALARLQIAAGEGGRAAGVTPGEWVLLEVRDTGVAMTEEVQRHVFEPFFTTKEKGTGLGLATCYGIVKQNGGHISVESEPSRGTCFRILLPYVPQASASTPRSALEELPAGHETVLLVEDEPAVRRIASLVLRERGYHVLEAGDGEEGLSVARDGGIELDLLVTDVAMPRLGGRLLGERLQAERPALRVLYMSGFTGGDSALQQEIEAAGLPFLQKPFTPAALARKVRDVLDGEKHLQD